MQPVDEPHDLQRFVRAQGPVFDAVRDELGAGRKRSHWMWFVFPQLRGLGHSELAHHFGIASLAEARASWRQPLLGARLRECAELLDALPPHRTAMAVFGAIDARKLRSCLTLFELAAPDEPRFGRLLDRFHGSERDPQTRDALAAGA